MRLLIIFVLTSSLFAMEIKETVVEIERPIKVEEVKCECKLCKGIKIAVASNIVSILIAAGATMLINYSQCSK